MALTKETLVPASSIAVFVRKESSNDGRSLIFYFQTNDYIEEYDMEIPAEDIILSVGEENLKAFAANLKFTIPADQLSREKFESLLTAKPMTRYQLNYAYSPQVLQSDDNRAIKYAKMKFRGMKPIENKGTNTTATGFTTTTKPATTIPATPANTTTNIPTNTTPASNSTGAVK